MSQMEQETSFLRSICAQVVPAIPLPMMTYFLPTSAANFSSPSFPARSTSLTDARRFLSPKTTGTILTCREGQLHRASVGGQDDRRTPADVDRDLAGAGERAKDRHLWRGASRQREHRRHRAGAANG